MCAATDTDKLIYLAFLVYTASVSLDKQDKYLLTGLNEKKKDNLEIAHV